MMILMIEDITPKLKKKLTHKKNEELVVPYVLHFSQKYTNKGRTFEGRRRSRNKYTA